MRQNHSNEKNNVKIMICDDSQGIIDALRVVFNREGFYSEGVTDPDELIKRLKAEKFDILILDYILENGITGDTIVRKIREFSNIYIMLLTGYKNLLPPVETLRNLDIESYCEKQDKFDQVLLNIEIALKAIKYINNVNSQEFPERLSMLRKMHGYSQDDLARLTNIPRSTISELESGKYYPNSLILIKFSKFFGVTVDYLLNVEFYS